MSSTTTTGARLAHATVGAVLVLALGAPTSPTAASVSRCGVSAGYTVCLAVPETTLTGDAPITVTVTGSDQGIVEMEFAWGPEPTSRYEDPAGPDFPLLLDGEAPWGFVWPTARYPDATLYLNVRVSSSSGLGAPVAIESPLTLDNGVTSLPTNAADWSPPIPREISGDPVYAAVGDGADGGAHTASVLSSVLARDPALLLYLGDIYERGTWAEWHDHYGVSALDDPSAPGTSWGTLARSTLYALGNHEAHEIPAYRDYWHQPPDYYALDHGGIRFLVLSSECATVVPCGVGSPQYEFVEDQLASLPADSCVVSLWHRPRLGTAANDSTRMHPIWGLLADGGGDLVLNGHVHAMIQYRPMDADLQVGQPDSHMVQLISGAGGHNLAVNRDTDARVGWQTLGTAGAVFVSPVVDLATGETTALEWVYEGVNGSPVQDGTGRAGRGRVECATPSEPGSQVLFADGFEGGFSSWTRVNNLSLDPSMFGEAAPSAKGSPTGTTAAFAYETLSPARPAVCLETAVKLSSLSASTVLGRLRTSSGGGIARVFVLPSRALRVRSEVSQTTFVPPGATLSSAWTVIEFCGTTGSSGSLRLRVDGSLVGTWTANLGTASIGQVQVGDHTKRTFTLNLDDVTAFVPST